MIAPPKKKPPIACDGPYLPVPLAFLRSRACAELSPHGAKLMMDVFSLLGVNAKGNGDLSLSPKRMKVRGWSGRETLNAAIKELLEHRLLIETRQGGRLDCRLFACTLYSLNCDPKKVNARPGDYSRSDYMGPSRSMALPPIEAYPVTWRRVRKS